MEKKIVITPEENETNVSLCKENIIVTSGGGAVKSVNGQIGDVVLTTSDLENTSDYQTGSEVANSIDLAIADKQNVLSAGDNITIENNTISATDTNTTYTAGQGLNLNGTVFSANTSILATQEDLTSKVDASELNNYYTKLDIGVLLSNKQDTLTAGNNITITNNEISATDTTYTAGDNISISNGEISAIVDSALSSASEHPVQNKVIYSTIGDIETILQTLNSGSGAVETN